MDNHDLLQRIAVNPRVMAGKPVIRGTRLTVQFILGLLAQGATEADILNEYEGLAPEDIRACIAFAQDIVDDALFLPLKKAA